MTAQITNGQESGSNRKVALLAVTKISGIDELPFRKVVTPTVNTPIKTAFMPRVIIRGFIPNKPTAKPLIDPMRMQKKAPHNKAVMVPEGDLTLTIKAAPAAIIASDKSIPPVSMQMV
jgi:hypothetical protein